MTRVFKVPNALFIQYLWYCITQVEFLNKISIPYHFFVILDEFENRRAGKLIKGDISEPVYELKVPQITANHYDQICNNCLSFVAQAM